MADLAERLGRATGRIELDQAELARVLGTNPRTVSRWLSRQTAPRPDARERLLSSSWSSRSSRAFYGQNRPTTGCSPQRLTRPRSTCSARASTDVCWAQAAISRSGIGRRGAAPLPELAVGGEGGRDRLGVHPQLRERVEMLLDPLVIRRRARTLQHLQPRDRAQARLAQRPIHSATASDEGRLLE